MSCSNFQKQSCQLCENVSVNFNHTADLRNISDVNNRVDVVVSYNSKLTVNHSTITILLVQAHTVREPSLKILHSTKCSHVMVSTKQNLSYKRY